MRSTVCSFCSSRTHYNRTTKSQIKGTDFRAEDSQIQAWGEGVQGPQVDPGGPSNILNHAVFNSTTFNRLGVSFIGLRLWYSECRVHLAILTGCPQAQAEQKAAEKATKPRQGPKHQAVDCLFPWSFPLFLGSCFCLFFKAPTRPLVVDLPTGESSVNGEPQVRIVSENRRDTCWHIFVVNVLKRYIRIIIYNGFATATSWSFDRPVQASTIVKVPVDLHGAVHTKQNTTEIPSEQAQKHDLAVTAYLKRLHEDTVESSHLQTWKMFITST